MALYFQWHRIQGTLSDIGTELRRAVEVHRAMVSAHEGYAILLEEVDELWTEIKNKEQDAAAIRKEAIQVAAMALEIAILFGKDV